MKIGIFDPYLDTLSGGERYILTAASCLSSKHSVSIFWDDPSILEKASRRFTLPLENLTTVKNVFSSSISFKERFLATKSFDRILFLSDGSIPITGAKKTIVHFQFPVEWVKSTILTKLKLQRIPEVICNSYFTKEYIDRKFHIESTVIYPPVHLLKHEKNKKKNVILTVGRFSPLKENDDYKKIGFMINAFKRLIDSGVEGWEFIIVTTSFEKDKERVLEMKEQAKGYHISFRENISQYDIEDVFSIAKIYWHAAGYKEDVFKNPHRMEHFGISTVEAMSAQCIPIVINAGGQKEIIQDGVNGYLWNTEDELLKKTKNVIEAKNSPIHINEEELSQKFSQERFCREITQIFI